VKTLVIMALTLLGYTFIYAGLSKFTTGLTVSEASGAAQAT
jgi:uncharacterized membrane protein YphA (DoxX/SURF4 family)